MGFKADVIIWLFEGRQLYCRLTLHRVKVQAVAFSPSDKYLATLGGSDDNRLVRELCIYTCTCMKTQPYQSCTIYDGQIKSRK